MELFINIINYSVGFLVAFLILYWLIAPLFHPPFWPSSSLEILKLLELADVNENDIVVDLGSGDGRVVLAASRVCKKAVGIEYNPFLSLFSRFMELISANGEVEFKHKNYWKEDLSPYSVVIMYLNSEASKALTAKLVQELKPGARIVSKTHKLPGLKPIKTIENSYYLYKIAKDK